MFDVMVMTENGLERVVESDVARLEAYAEEGCALQLGSCRVRRVDDVYSVVTQSTLVTVGSVGDALGMLLGEQAPLSPVPPTDGVYDSLVEVAA